MPRYIDEKDVYALVEPSGIARVHCAQIDELPRADVVPKSEVEKLQNELVIWKQNRFNLYQKLECYEMARQKLASEIFEEIENYVIKGITVGGEHLTLFNGRNFAELKKKRTEQCPDCKHFVGCEKAVWSGRCEDFDFVRKEDDAYEKGYNDALKDVEEMILERKNENTPKI